MSNAGTLTEVSDSVAETIIAEGAEPIARIAKLADVSPSTAVRWHLYGCLNASGHRVYLEAIRCGRRLKTSRAALRRYLDRMSDRTSSQSSPEIRSPSERNRVCDKAELELARRFRI